jgi:amino acid adenylation domain-containing protein
VLLAQIWQEVLKLDRVGRQDNFFELGGHSLLAVSVLERMRAAGFGVDVRTLFSAPRLTELAQQVDGRSLQRESEAPANLITGEVDRITPELLPLVKLTQGEIDRIVEQVPGGVSNLQDIYGLAPLQEGIVFHHLMGGEGDAYLLSVQMRFDSWDRVQGYVRALDAVVARHDILRTGIFWEGLSEPVQAVLRQARVPVEQVEFAEGSGDVAEQLRERFDPRVYRLDIRQAPLLRVYVAQDRRRGGWVLLQLFHHLALDHTALDQVHQEISALWSGAAVQLPRAQPFRNLVWQARLRSDRSEQERYFRERLADVQEPTLAYGLLADESVTAQESHRSLDKNLSQRLRQRARALGVSAASLCHLAWAVVLSRLSAREDVVFGTVLFGRMDAGEGADRALGVFINTLPVRVRVDGTRLAERVRQVHEQLVQLLGHEHASLALAQCCSGVSAPLPLFNTVLNYRYSQSMSQSSAWEGVEFLARRDGTHYPLTLSIDDLGDGLALTAQTHAQIDAQRVCGYMHEALEQLVAALEGAPSTALSDLGMLPASERAQLVEQWNATAAAYPDDKCIHELFEAQAAAHPEAVAVECEDARVSYGELNAQANRLAHHLRALGVKPDDRVAICVERSIELVTAELAVLKCGAAYVPIDASFPEERQAYMIRDCDAKLVLVREGKELPEGLAATRVEIDAAGLPEEGVDNLGVEVDSELSAYVMYTSGSAGQPKGVIVPHRAVGRLVLNNGYLKFEASDRVAFAANPAFDATTMEVWGPLLNGGCIVVIDQGTVLNPNRFSTVLKEQAVTVLFLTTALFNSYVATSGIFSSLRALLTGGERNDPFAFRQVLHKGAPKHLIHCYGPTETTTFAITSEVVAVPEGMGTIPIGRPISNTRIYILDGRGHPAPVGVAGELYIGGAGVARGYLNRPDLTAERFIASPFVAGDRLYRTGDLARYLPDGDIEFLGRNDYQVKIRGFRIECGEIEARLGQHPGVREAVVVARQDGSGDQALVAYYTVATGAEAVDAQALREHVQQALPQYMAPAAYVQLPALPLTPNGKLDRKALPAPAGEAHARGGYEEPQGEVERELAQIWQEVLKLDRVGRQDNFFELGGHSLLAVKLIQRMHRQGLHVDLRALFIAPTLAQLAAVAAESGNSRANNVTARLLPFRNQVDPPSLFCIHPAGGLSWPYAALVPYIPERRGVYGLQSWKYTDTIWDPGTLEDVAKDYLSVIRDQQPRGPYFLLGWSYGGLVAFEIARRLEESGETVALLTLLDSYPFDDTIPPFVSGASQTAGLLKNLLKYLSYDEATIDSLPQPLDRSCVANLLCRDGYFPNMTSAAIDEFFTTLLEMFERNGQLAQAYRPASPLRAEILLFAATADADNARDEAIRKWTPQAAGLLTVHTVETTHMQMLSQDSLSKLGPLLRSRLEELLF